MGEPIIQASSWTCWTCAACVLGCMAGCVWTPAAVTVVNSVTAANAF